MNGYVIGLIVSFITAGWAGFYAPKEWRKTVVFGLWSLLAPLTLITIAVFQNSRV